MTEPSNLRDAADVWDAAWDAWAENDCSAAVAYGEGYQQAIADVVEWLRARICDDWEWEEDWIEADACRKAASQIARRFGKDA